MGVFKVLWSTIKDVFDELFALVVMNVIWVCVSMPLVLIAFLLLANGFIVMAALVGVLAILPMAPANAGLYTAAQRVTEGRVFQWRVFFEGFRENLQLSWKVYGIWYLGLVLIISNLSFYATIDATYAAFLMIVFLYLLLVWYGLLIYIGPLMLIQVDKRIRIIARNALLMVFGRPVFTLLTMILMGAVVVLSTFVPVLPFLLTFSFLAHWSFRATTQLIEDAEARRQALEAKEQTATLNTEKGRGGQVRPRN